MNDSPKLPNCARCGHSPHWHRLPSGHSPTDTTAPFRCLGPHLDGCPTSCPDYANPNPGKDRHPA